jgi:hypothetical protein
MSANIQMALLCNTLIIFMDTAQLCLLAAQEPLFLPADFVQITLTYVKASNCHRADEAFQRITGIIASLHSHKNVAWQSCRCAGQVEGDKSLIRVAFRRSAALPAACSDARKSLIVERKEPSGTTREHLGTQPCLVLMITYCLAAISCLRPQSFSHYTFSSTQADYHRVS